MLLCAIQDGVHLRLQTHLYLYTILNYRKAVDKKLDLI
jgi:hypothetical protein